MAATTVLTLTAQPAFAHATASPASPRWASARPAPQAATAFSRAAPPGADSAPAGTRSSAGPAPLALSPVLHTSRAGTAPPLSVLPTTASLPARPSPGAGTPSDSSPSPPDAGEESGAGDGAGDASGAPGPARPGAKPVGQLLGELSGLYRSTEAASESYNAIEEKLKKQRKDTRRAQAGLARARTALADGRAHAGQLARQQYRTGVAGGLPPAVRMLLMRDPYRFLEQGHLLRRAADSQAAAVRQLTSGEKQHATAVEQARQSLERQQKLAEKKKRQRDTVRAKLKEVEKLLASLTGEELSRMRELEQQRTDAAQRKLMESGALGGPASTGQAASLQGRRALAYAMDQIGKPYVWGAEGPDAFDCSGLTARAWQHAGHAIPRTSQEQWRRLPHVPLNQLRPGDLVIYHSGATHVGIYAGSGRVVQAPRPGGKVKLTPLATDPPIGAVRPDGKGQGVEGAKQAR